MEHQVTLVTIGIPFYNSEKYLAFAINSVLKQTISNWELFLMDDGSTDNSLNIAKNFEKIDPRIQVISDGKNKGLPTRLNELSDLATGTYYCRMDADDMMLPNRIEKQLEYLLANTKIDLVGTGLIAIDNNNAIIGLRKGVANPKVTLDDIFTGTWAVHPTIMGKSIWFKENRYDANLKRAQDYDLWIRTVEKSYFSKINEPYLYYREASTSTIKKYFVAMNNLVKIFWKNTKFLGFFKSIKLTLTSIFKSIIYVMFWAFGKTYKLIERRSKKLKKQELIEHNKVITSITNHNY